MSTMPGFSAEAALGSRIVTARRGAWEETPADGRVVPAVIDCEHRCLLKLIDCLEGHEQHCSDRYQMCKFWCRVGSIS